MSIDTRADARFVEWAERNLQIATRQGVEWTCWCNNPNHDDTTPSMRFNVERGAYYCHACNHRGWVNLKGIINSPEIDFEAEMTKIIGKLDSVQDESSTGRVEESLLRRYDVRSDYWKTRKIGREMQSKFQLGYDVFKDAVTIPSRDINGNLLGVTHRFLDPEHKGGRYHYPFGFRKSEQLFASWLVAADPKIRRVAITEGALDAIRLWQVGQPAVALYGALPSAEQLRLLDMMGVDEIVLFLDNDREGRAGTQRCLGRWQEKKRINYRPETDMGQLAMIWIVNYRLDVKDVGEMSDYAIKRHLDKAERLI